MSAALSRRALVLAGVAAALGPAQVRAWGIHGKGNAMYGLIGKITATPGQREALAAILLEGTTGMPGCLSYVVARDPADADALWVTEVWESAEAHRASLSLPTVQGAITRGRPLIGGVSDRHELDVIGGHGLGLGR